MKEKVEQIRCAQINEKKGEACNARLLDNYNNGKIDSIVIKCPKCGKYNVISR